MTTRYPVAFVCRLFALLATPLHNLCFYGGVGCVPFYECVTHKLFLKLWGAKWRAFTKPFTFSGTICRPLTGLHTLSHSLTFPVDGVLAE